MQERFNKYFCDGGADSCSGVYPELPSIYMLKKGITHVGLF